MLSDASQVNDAGFRASDVISIAGAVGLICVCLIPIYFVLFPQLTDLQQHILVSKLLWEHLAGISRLDLEMSGYVGYRLSSYLIVLLIATLDALGISLIYLPKIVAAALLTIHVAIISWIFFRADDDHTLASALLRMGLAFPAAVAMYSACWFMGFVGYTLAISILTLAVYATEVFLARGSYRDLLTLFILLVLVYTAHPFALTFWLLWCLSRGLASVVTWVIRTEWKQLLLLPLTFLPIALYDYLMRNSPGSASSPFLNFASIFVESAEWSTNRYGALLSGMYFQADRASDGTWMAYLFVGFILTALAVAVVARAERRIWALSLTGILFLVASSLINEKFFPVPQGHWLAYNYRFVSTAAVVCLATAGVVIFRSTQGNTGLRWFASFAAVIAAVMSAVHLNSVRKAYERFDAPATEYIQKQLAFERPIGTVLPSSAWYPDVTFLRRYSCLTMPDCNPAGTLFRNLGGDVYPIRMRSTRRVWPERIRTDINAFKGGEGYLLGQYSRPRGIAADAGGGFAVADTGNQRVQMFDAEGNLVSWISDVLGTTLIGPKAVAFDPSASVYVLDGPALLRFGADRSFVKKWSGSETGLFEPADLDIDEAGNVFIVDQTRGTVTRFEPKTEIFTKLDITSGNELRRPTGIAVADDLLYIADSGNDRIQVFDVAGKWVRQWAVPVWARYGFHYPDVAVDPIRNRVYVTSGWTGEVIVFDTKGKFLRNLELPSGTESNNPSAIAISKTNGRLYLLGYGSAQVDNGDPGVVAVDVAE